MVILKSIKQLKRKLLECFTSYDSIGLITHKNPDGDGLCTCLALQELIINSFPQTFINTPDCPNITKSVDIILEEAPPRNFDFLQADKRTIIYQDSMAYSLIIMLDSQSSIRVGKCAPLLENAENILVIDHHESSLSENELDTYKNVFLFNNPLYVSAGAIIFDSLDDNFRSLKSASKKYCATNLYISILNDTNNFTNSNTNSDVFNICSRIISLDISPHNIVRDYTSSRSPAYYKFVGQALSTISTYENEAILFFHSTQQMLSDNNLKLSDTSKIIDVMKGLANTTKVIVYFKEVDSDKYRLSLRSNFINVNEIASFHGGGGHRKASGCSIKGKLEIIQQQILDLIINQL